MSLSNFPTGVDVFKTIPTPTLTRTDTSDASDDTLSTRLQQHSDAIVAAQTYLLSNGLSATGSFGGNHAYDLLNYRSFMWSGSIAASLTITLNHLADCVPVYLRVLNSGGGSATLILAATTPAGASYTIRAAPTHLGTEVNMAVGLSIPSGVIESFWGMTNMTAGILAFLAL